MLWCIFDVTDVIVKLFIVRGVRLVKIVTLYWNIVVLMVKHFLGSI